MYRIEHGSGVTPNLSWEEVLESGIIGGSVFEWVRTVGWVFVGEL